MEKYAWRGKIVPGMQEEYKKRHDNIWPEMKEVLANAGIVNYSIWMQGEELFGYYECEKGVEYAAKEQAALLEEKSVTLSIKAGEGGKAFGSVSSKEIAAAYKEQCNMEIDKKKIQLPESIKTFGMHEVPVKLHPQVTGKLHVKVVEA